MDKEDAKRSETRNRPIKKLDSDYHNITEQENFFLFFYGSPAKNCHSCGEHFRYVVRGHLSKDRLSSNKCGVENTNIFITRGDL